MGAPGRPLAYFVVIISVFVGSSGVECLNRYGHARRISPLKSRPMKGIVKDNLFPPRDGAFFCSETISHFSLPLPRWSCANIDLYRTLPLHLPATCARTSVDLSSYRDFQSTSAVVLTTVLSEA